jgi:hypothetical protein
MCVVLNLCSQVLHEEGNKNIDRHALDGYQGCPGKNKSNESPSD